MSAKSRGMTLAVALLVMLFGWVVPAVAFEGSGGDHYDPTHGYASSESESLLEFKSDKAIFTALVFDLLCAGLYLAAWKPISQGLARREATIANQIADAQRASEQAAVKLKEYEAKLADAAVQAQELVNQAKKDAAVVAERLKVDAQNESTRMIERARSEIETAKQVPTLAVRNQRISKREWRG